MWLFPLRACVCPNAQGTGDHPGPLLGTGSVRGRGAPQIDILGYFDENADTDVISQSYHVAPASGNQPARGITESQTTLNPWQGTTTYVSSHPKSSYLIAHSLLS